jgi:hypothetical protein
MVIAVRFAQSTIDRKDRALRRIASMDATTSLNPITAQHLVARYAALLEEHTNANAFPASVAALPASKLAIKSAVRTVLEALARTNQLTTELAAFLEDVYVALASYVPEEVAALAAEHRRASEALEADSRQPRERLESPNWGMLSRTSRLAGEVARASAEEAETLRREFRALVDARTPSAR